MQSLYPKYGECTIIALFLSPSQQRGVPFRALSWGEGTNFIITPLFRLVLIWKISVFTDHRKSIIFKAYKNFMSKPENDKVFVKYKKRKVCQYLASLHQLNIEKIEVVFITNQSGYLQIRHATLLVLIQD